MTAKKKCCKDKPRCTKCPVVLMRLTQMGHAEKNGKDGSRGYKVSAKLPKKQLALARAR